MKNKLFHVDEKTKSSIIEELKGCLEKQENIAFAYLHGSFVTEERFKDIDVSVYLTSLLSSVLEVELELETELGNVIRKYPLDVRVLNGAPLSFRYNVIRHGFPLVVKDDDARADFVEATLADYFDFAPFRENYLKEVLSSGI